jgi:hypothetical protein
MKLLKEVKMSIQEEGIVKNNAIIDHLEAVRRIVKEKCVSFVKGVGEKSKNFIFALFDGCVVTLG